MLLELFPFVILNNVMAFIYAYFFSDILRFDMSLLLLTVTLRGVSNKHCLLSLFSLSLLPILTCKEMVKGLILMFYNIFTVIASNVWTNLFLQNCNHSEI